MASNPLVHVIDDDEAMRDSLQFLLQSHKIDVRTHESAKAFLQKLSGLKVGCIITDVRMPEISGVELLHRLKELRTGMPVIVITGHGDLPLAVEAMKLGAVDFLEKPFDDEVLLAAVRSALAHWNQKSLEHTEKAELQERFASLSTREREVLQGLLAGSPNKTIAHDLDISPRTVEVYRANVMTKMKAASLSELVRMGLLVGMIGSHNS
ncbi:MAG TPA: response regulator FixJ [Aestuariivirgaceae bacterium]|jgi:two-component system response regulator FixJ